MISLYLPFQYKLHVVNYLAAACITMKAILLECLSVICNYAIFLGPIVRLSAYTMLYNAAY